MGRDYETGRISYLSLVLCEKICRNNEIKDTVDRGPCQELDKKFEGRLGNHTTHPRSRQCCLLRIELQ